MKKGYVTILVAFTLCCGIGIGLFLGIDSQKAKTVKLEKDKGQLTADLVEAEFYITLVDLRVKSLLEIWAKMIEEEDRALFYNNEAFGN